MGAVAISSRALVRHAVAPAMDVVAHGLAEQDRIFNRREGVDSLLELAPVLADGVDERELALFVSLCGQVAALNVQQVRTARMLAGWSDRLAVDLHALETAGKGLAPKLTQQALAGRLRGPLGTLAEPAADVLVLVDAVRDLDEVLAGVPRAQLFTGSLANLLGARKYRLLTVLDERRRARCEP